MKTSKPHTGAEALRTAIKQYGGALRLAEALGVKPQAIANWVSRGTPKEKCLVIENLTGVRCEELRPDLNWVDLQSVSAARARRSLDSADDVQPVGGRSQRSINKRMHKK
ncbi:helix-turn-helix domain-containing protein [Paraburkholderia sp. Tr-20389]|nr:helix-turn-helix domain-containing protein [Paraburkholderia sp. Tr-20389]